MIKHRADSYTESVHIVFSEYLNGISRAYGGALAAWMDEVGVIVGRRHTNMNVTTAQISQLSFLAPAFPDDVVVTAGYVTYTGRTSLEIAVRTYIERLDGQRDLIAQAYMTFVALGEDGRPAPCPQLEPVTDEEKADWEAALRRRELAKAAK